MLCIFPTFLFHGTSPHSFVFWYTTVKPDVSFLIVNGYIYITFLELFEYFLLFSICVLHIATCLDFFLCLSFLPSSFLAFLFLFQSKGDGLISYPQGIEKPDNFITNCLSFFNLVCPSVGSAENEEFLFGLNKNGPKTIFCECSSTSCIYSSNYD